MCLFDQTSQCMRRLEECTEEIMVQIRTLMNSLRTRRWSVLRSSLYRKGRKVIPDGDFPFFLYDGSLKDLRLIWARLLLISHVPIQQLNTSIQRNNGLLSQRFPPGQTVCRAAKRRKIVWTWQIDDFYAVICYYCSLRKHFSCEFHHLNLKKKKELSLILIAWDSLFWVHRWGIFVCVGNSAKVRQDSPVNNCLCALPPTHSIITDTVRGTPTHPSISHPQIKQM